MANVAKILGRSEQRRRVFRAIYAGKKKVKTKSEIARSTKLSEMRVLQEAGRLTGNHIVELIKVKGETAYKKIAPFTINYKKILALDKKKLARFPTKVNPQFGNGNPQVIVKYPKNLIDAKMVSIDEIDTFSKIKKIPLKGFMTPVDEKKFKNFIKRIIGEAGEFTDWGGEKNDLFTTHIKLKNKRISAVFAFKGKGKKGILKPNMMGKNGDQISRLFQTFADMYILQYWSQIDQSVYELMHSLAISVSAIYRTKVHYCIIDGQDTARLIEAYSIS
jgi:hypothetical protein